MLTKSSETMVGALHGVSPNLTLTPTLTPINAGEHSGRGGTEGTRKVCAGIPQLGSLTESRRCSGRAVVETLGASDLSEDPNIGIYSETKENCFPKRCRRFGISPDHMTAVKSKLQKCDRPQKSFALYYWDKHEFVHHTMKSGGTELSRNACSARLETAISLPPHGELPCPDDYNISKGRLDLFRAFFSLNKRSNNACTTEMRVGWC